MNLVSIGGATVKDCTRRVLRHVLTDNCARQVNWKGRGGKLAFSEMDLTSVINSKFSMLYSYYFCLTTVFRVAAAVATATNVQVI